MEYQSYVWSLGRPPRAEEDPSREGSGLLPLELFDLLLPAPPLDEAASADIEPGAEEGTPAGEVFVMVSKSTLQRLGVWESVAPKVIGASMPAAAKSSRLTDLKSRLRARLHGGAATVSLGEYSSAHVLSSASLPGGKFVHAETMHQRSSPTDPWAGSPIVLAMEGGLFAGTLQAMQPTQTDPVKIPHDLFMDTFKRVSSVLEGIVRQDPEPEVMGVDDSPYELLDAKAFAERMKVTDQTVYNQEKAGRLISVLSPGRERGRRFPSFQLSSRLNRELHQDAISMYRSRGEDMTLYWDFLRTRHEVFGGSTGVDFLLNRVANPALQDLAPDDLAALFLEAAEEDLHRAVS